MDTKQFQQYMQTDMFDKFQNPICKGDFVLINSKSSTVTGFFLRFAGKFRRAGLLSFLWIDFGNRRIFSNPTSQA